MKSSTERLVSFLKMELKNFSSSEDIKKRIGDSVNNNRVPSIRQVIRYLRNLGFANYESQGLEYAYNLLRRKNLFHKVRRNNNRTDAYDINEFFTVIDRYVKSNPTLKGQVSKAIGGN